MSKGTSGQIIATILEAVGNGIITQRDNARKQN